MALVTEVTHYGSHVGADHSGVGKWRHIRIVRACSLDPLPSSMFGSHLIIDLRLRRTLINALYYPERGFQSCAPFNSARAHLLFLTSHPSNLGAESFTAG